MDNASGSFQFHEALPNTFIFEVPNALSAEQCAAMITRFEERTDQQQPGRLGQQGNTDGDPALAQILAGNLPVRRIWCFSAGAGGNGI